MERQSNGLKVENHAVNTYYHGERTGYIDPFDSFGKEKIPIQIKTKKIDKISQRTKIELGSFMRLPKTKDFILDIFFYNSSNTIYCRKIFKINAQKWNSNISEEMLQLLDYHHVFHSISNRHEDDSKWTDRRKFIKEQYKALGSIFTPLFKRDHKRQKRIQASIALSDILEMSKDYKTEYLNLSLEDI